MLALHRSGTRQFVTLPHAFTNVTLAIFLDIYSLKSAAASSNSCTLTCTKKRLTQPAEQKTSTVFCSLLNGGIRDLACWDLTFETIQSTKCNVFVAETRNENRPSGIEGYGSSEWPSTMLWWLLACTCATPKMPQMKPSARTNQSEVLSTSRSDKFRNAPKNAFTMH